MTKKNTDIENETTNRKSAALPKEGPLKKPKNLVAGKRDKEEEEDAGETNVIPLKHIETPRKSNPSESIFSSLVERGLLKKNIIDGTRDVFSQIKVLLKDFYSQLNDYLKEQNIDLDVAYTDRNDTEVELRLSDDVLFFTLNTNVYRFDLEHHIWQSPYIEEDPNRADCGMILIYNFLSDSFKYNRNLDTGYLIGRIFVNKDKHLFVEGKRQLGFLYSDIENGLATDKLLQDIIKSAIVYTMNFEIHVPAYDAMKEMTVQQKLDQTGTPQKAVARLGFKFSTERDPTPPPAY
jgi:hypothetical protein